MNKVLKVLNMRYHFQKKHKVEIKRLEKTLKKYKIDLKVENEKAFFIANVISKSIELKEKLDQFIFPIIEELRKYQAILIFSEKNKILVESLKQEIQKCDIMMSGKQKIIFPIFDEKINHIYIEEPASMMTPFFDQFQEKWIDKIDTNIYQPAIFQSMFFYGVFYDEHAIYYNHLEILLIDDKVLHIKNQNIVKIIEAYRKNDPIQLVELVWNDLSIHQQKKLKKYRKEV